MKLYKNSNGMHLTQETRKWKTVKNKRENRRKEKKERWRRKSTFVRNHQLTI